MDGIELDLAKLVKFGVTTGLNLLTARTGMQLGEVETLGHELVDSAKLAPIAVDPVAMMIGKMVMSGLDAQRKRTRERQAHDNEQSRSG